MARRGRAACHSELGELEYLDFDITIKPTDGSDYEVSVRSPGGQSDFPMHFPFDDQTLRAQLEALEVALLRSRVKSRRVVSREEQTVEGFGRALFAALIGKVSDLYKLSQQRAGEDKGLRVVLHINDPRLAAVPWEFLYDPEQREYVCLSRHTPIVRYPDQAAPVNPISVRPPLRILGMAVSPKGLPKLDLQREKKRMEDAVRPLAGLVELKWLQGQTSQDLQNAISAGPWHVFHFIGHGEYSAETDEGCVILADEEGGPERLNALNLARVLQHRPLKMVVLNACEGAKGGGKDMLSSTASPLLLKGVQAVLAMQYEISDDAAVEFSRSFYGALCRGVPIEEALSEARISIAIGNSVEWGTPVLHLRAESGRLFDINLGGERLTTMLTQARAHLAEGDWASAIAHLQVIAAADPSNATAAAELERASARQQLDLLYENGKARFEAGRFKSAQRLFQQVRAKEGNYRDTEELLRRVEEKLNERRATLLLRKAEDCINLGQLDGAAENLTAALELRPDHEAVSARLEFVRKRQELAACYESGVRHRAEGRTVEALASFRQAQLIDPGYKDLSTIVAEMEAVEARRFSGRLKAFRTWFVAARRRVQVAMVAAFALVLGASVYGGILLKRYVWPSPYMRAFPEPFMKTTDGSPDAKIWTYPSHHWSIVPGRDNDPDDMALLVTGTGTGIAHGKVFGDFEAEFTVQHLSGTRAAWMLRAWPDWRGGYCGYYFELIKESDNLVLKSETRRCFLGTVSLDTGQPDSQTIGIKTYGQRPDDNIYVKVTAHGNKFSYRFSLQSTNSTDQRVDTQDEYPLELVDDNNYFTSGLFGLVGVSDDSRILYEYLLITPLAGSNSTPTPAHTDESGR